MNRLKKKIYSRPKSQGASARHSKNKKEKGGGSYIVKVVHHRQIVCKTIKTREDMYKMNFKTIPTRVSDGKTNALASGGGRNTRYHFFWGLTRN